MKIHEKYMARCIQLAKNGLGTTYPNPMVGSVIVHDKTIIGEGWHRKAGEPHAEVLAIASVLDKSLLENATLYVSLEPCSHYGKTPPCADLIIKNEIKKVVIGSTDPNPKVSGRGIKKLMEAGCEVIVGVSETACDLLNKRFFTFQNKKRPFIFLKWAETADGFIAPELRDKISPVWITNKQSRQLVHQMRANEQAILVGTNTVLMDNPSLTTRDWLGSSPMRVVIDRSLKVPREASVYDDRANTIFITENDKSLNIPTNEVRNNISYEKIDFSENIAEQICELLYQRNLQSVIIEGGAKTLNTFIEANLWDEASIFKGKATFGSGVKAPMISGEIISEKTIDDDQLIVLKNNNS